MPYNFKEINKRLLKIGFEIVRQNSSHVLFSNGKTIFPVPNHPGKDISPGVERSIIKNLGISAKDFKSIK